MKGKIGKLGKLYYAKVGWHIKLSFNCSKIIQWAIDKSSEGLTFSNGVYETKAPINTYLTIEGCTFKNCAEKIER